MPQLVSYSAFHMNLYNSRGTVKYIVPAYILFYKMCVEHESPEESDE